MRDVGGVLMSTGKAWIAAAVALACLMFALGQTSAVAVPAETPPCVSPVGDDLNEAFDTDDAIVTPFCSEVGVGDHWRPVVRVVVAGDDRVFPLGYLPTQPDLDEDLVSKLVSARYVVDAGTRQQRTYVVAAADLTFQHGALPDGSPYVRWAPRLHPLPPGDHTVDMHVTLSADAWDGFGDDRAFNLIPAGESFIETLHFTVAPKVLA